MGGRFLVTFFWSWKLEPVGWSFVTACAILGPKLEFQIAWWWLLGTQIQVWFVATRHSLPFGWPGGRRTNYILHSGKRVAKDTENDGWFGIIPLLSNDFWGIFWCPAVRFPEAYLNQEKMGGICWESTKTKWIVNFTEHLCVCLSCEFLWEKYVQSLSLPWWYQLILLKIYPPEV